MEKKELEKMEKVKVLLYCTKAKPFLFEHKTDDNQVLYVTTRLGNADNLRINHKKVLNGKIVAECEVETEEIRLWGDEIENYFGNNEEINIEKDSCLNFEQIEQYLCSNDYKGYALHISNLRIFDEPATIEYANLESPLIDSELIGGSWLCEDCDTPNDDCKHCYNHYEFFKTVEKAPQNMMRVYSNIGRYNCQYVLISIRPEWLCKILNGEKTIEVRKKVLKEMLE